MPSFGRGAQTGVNNPFNMLNMMKGNDLDFESSRGKVEQATFDRAMC